MPNCLYIDGISIQDGENVGCKKKDGTIRLGFYDRALGAIVWHDDFTNSPTDFMIMQEIGEWLKE